MDNDTALLMEVVDNEAAPVIIVVSIHLHHITRTDVHVQPEKKGKSQKQLSYSWIGICIYTS